MKKNSETNISNNKNSEEDISHEVKPRKYIKVPRKYRRANFLLVTSC